MNFCDNILIICFLVYKIFIRWYFLLYIIELIDILLYYVVLIMLVVV